MCPRPAGLWAVWGVLWVISICCRAGEPAPVPGTHGHYAVLTATPHGAAPFGVVDVLYGPREDLDGIAHLWWQRVFVS